VAVKGVALLIDACANLRREGLDFDVHLIGEGPLGPALQRRVAHLGLNETVTFRGPVAPASLADWFRAADATVLPSLSEGMPNVLLESIACGTPFVASDVGGIASIAANGLDTLVPAGDVEALTSALRATLTEPDRATAVTRAVMPVSWADTAQIIGQALDDVVGGSSRRFAEQHAACTSAVANAHSHVSKVS
jgi:glycosyltransferase involved in cell wall biosynthesis